MSNRLARVDRFADATWHRNDGTDGASGPTPTRLDARLEARGVFQRVSEDHQHFNSHFFRVGKRRGYTASS